MQSLSITLASLADCKRVGLALARAGYQVTMNPATLTLHYFPL